MANENSCMGKKAIREHIEKEHPLVEVPIHPAILSDEIFLEIISRENISIKVPVTCSPQHLKRIILVLKETVRL